ncbi:MAG TPA: dihydrodipicolinate synthase family protein [Roseiflexaceae bacterium]
MIAPGAPMPPEALQGIVPALITPLDPDGHVDEASVVSLVEFQIAAGVHGLLVLGSTGEGPLLSIEDKLRLVRSTVAAARGRVPVMVGIAHSSPPESVAFGNLAHQAGANALVTTPPFYFLSSQPELIGYYRYLHPRLELPLITYDVPSAVKTKIAASTVRALAEEGLIIGIKDSSGDLAGFRDMLIATQHLPDFHALTGSEHFVDAAMLVGGHGGVLGLASVIPDVYVDICSSVRSGDWARANQLQQRAIAALQMIYGNSSGGSLTAGAIGSFKLALCEMGVIQHPTVSNPLLALTDEDRARVRTIMARVGINSPLSAHAATGGLAGRLR